jgi:hypothetical protein
MRITHSVFVVQNVRKNTPSIGGEKMEKKLSNVFFWVKDLKTLDKNVMIFVQKGKLIYLKEAKKKKR